MFRFIKAWRHQAADRAETVIELERLRTSPLAALHGHDQLGAPEPLSVLEQARRAGRASRGLPQVRQYDVVAHLHVTCAALKADGTYCGDKTVPGTATCRRRAHIRQRAAQFR